MQNRSRTSVTFSRTIVGLCLLCLLAAAGCAEATDYITTIVVVGSPAAFTGRKIVVAGVDMPAASRMSDLSELAGSEIWGTSLQLCTPIRDTFLHATLAVEVRQGQDVLWSEDLERRGCLFSAEAVGEQDLSRLLLRNDGTIEVEPDATALVEYACSAPNRPLSCGSLPPF